MPNLSERQIRILKIVIDYYNYSGKTISSIVLKEEFNLSSATIRKELNYLEQCGLLKKRHTSSGRIPTKLGYQWFIESSRNEINKEIVVNKKINDFLETLKDININTIEQTLNEISRLTNYTTLAFKSNSEETKVKLLRCVDLEPLNVLLILTTNDERMQTSKIRFNSEYEVSQFKKILLNLNESLSDVLLKDVDYIINNFIKNNLIGELDQYIEYLNHIIMASKKMSQKNIFLSGTSHLFDESINSNKVKHLLTKIEDSNFEDFNIKDSSNNFDVNIGEFEDDYTIINVKTKSSDITSLSLVGPQRMNYDELLVLLDHISKNMK